VTAEACLPLANQLFRDVVLIVERGVVPALTDVQKTQLQVAIGMALRQAAAVGREHERRER
jgi:hypothetical protein